MLFGFLAMMGTTHARAEPTEPWGGPYTPGTGSAVPASLPGCAEGVPRTVRGGLCMGCPEGWTAKAEPDGFGFGCSAPRSDGPVDPRL